MAHIFSAGTARLAIQLKGYGGKWDHRFSPVNKYTINNLNIEQELKRHHQWHWKARAPEGVNQLKTKGSLGKFLQGLLFGSELWLAPKQMMSLGPEQAVSHKSTYSLPTL